jgi:hypothetical protein
MRVSFAMEELLPIFQEIMVSLLGYVNRLMDSGDFLFFLHSNGFPSYVSPVVTDGGVEAHHYPDLPCCALKRDSNNG